ncbi:maleylpyruvate isomerase N-terminal domain-containing protein [Streptomyces sp. Je 1-4]|uniref:maleylpyruvate isomerase N-terminal domain-containing protein n=1 Tax=Streptomyces TaxID=1883 RepID=UPI0021D7FA94|nr:MULTISPECIES: maleylpyruvate isomerase N-terminal domain-containing protein [unclassified Streptomyces]UYB37816.1 maleylpyruvate isomerase N-terminal domain-containing protein [Streptomyces sp. Je 1-4]UZQ33735.1 maleylpyruvate isomerase N-terminal domain-containing protein [Streptomyces sp. Je 1-4] [Streptomyces sp. Je 1-4 4N24]UZQ41153.1 maleylpyruvate isomerase N-terminal domain-containing protein [Streptomyces sp. Je 1-4] [Streptomyces sp. Je 1-4 4N24_ara]
MTVTPTAATHLAPNRTAPAPTVPWTDLLAATTDDCLAALLKNADQDWSRPAHALDWTCRQTLDHLALGLMGYTGLLIARPDDRYITLFASLDPQAPIPACLDGLRIAASLLTSTVRDTPAQARAWHPWGHSDATGFAAMGITELAVHTYDITHALGLPWAPPDDLSTAALARLFPDAPSGHTPSDTLLWCTGRIPLPGLPRRADWQWDGTVR